MKTLAAVLAAAFLLQPAMAPAQQVQPRPMTGCAINSLRGELVNGVEWYHATDTCGNSAFVAIAMHSHPPQVTTATVPPVGWLERSALPLQAGRKGGGGGGGKNCGPIMTDYNTSVLNFAADSLTLIVAGGGAIVAAGATAGIGGIILAGALLAAYVQWMSGAIDLRSKAAVRQAAGC